MATELVKSPPCSPNGPALIRVTASSTDATVELAATGTKTSSRTIGLPQGVTDAGVTAHYEHGVLEVHVRKPEQPKPRKIEIGLGHKTIEGKAEKK